MIELLYYLTVFIGSVALLKAAFAFVKLLRVAANPLNQKWSQRYGKGSYALVTGCTEGIGKAFCQQLAALGFNLVLVSRNQTKLQNLSQTLIATHPELKTVICKADFAQKSQALYESVEKEIKYLDLSILVNNVGYMQIKRFDEFSQDQIEQQINTNLNAMTYLTRRIVPYFLSRKQHRCGIINMSSLMTQLNMSKVSIYTATKAYNHHLSACLTADYKGVIDVLSCTPGIVTTRATNHFNDIFACTARQCASWTLKALGLCQTTDGFWKHTVFGWAQSVAKMELAKQVSLFLAKYKFNQIHNSNSNDQ